MWLSRVNERGRAPRARAPLAASASGSYPKVKRIWKDHGMTASLDDALRRLDGALGQLELSVSRRLETERRRGDLETELQIMQDDRARLAVDLDGTTAQLGRVEAVTEDLGRRVTRALTSVAEVLAKAESHGVRGG